MCVCAFFFLSKATAAIAKFDAVADVDVVLHASLYAVNFNQKICAFYFNRLNSINIYDPPHFFSKFEVFEMRRMMTFADIKPHIFNGAQVPSITK